MVYTLPLGVFVTNEQPMAYNEGREEALQWIMDEGHFDELRKKIVESLRHNEGLKQQTMQLLEDSKTLDEKELTEQNKKMILDELRKELEGQVVDKACKTAWSLMADPQSEICSLIDEKVHEGLAATYQKRAK